MNSTVRASIEAAAPILELQKQACQSEAKIYDDFAIPPLLQTPDGLKRRVHPKRYWKQSAMDNWSVRSGLGNGGARATLSA